jgi:hypothetical protein
MDMNGGARYDAGQWPAGDQTTGSGPCDADWEGGGDSDVDAQDETGSTQQH